VILKRTKYPPYASLPTAFCTPASINKMDSGLISRFKNKERAKSENNLRSTSSKLSNN